ncbi:MAG: LysR family transcriptional regulator [Steroidobacteraceae bacterium]
MDIQSAQLRAFIAITEVQSFTAAARRLRISPSVLTVRIQKLEQQLGFCLLWRSSRGVRLSPVGVKFLPEARRLLQCADEVAEMAARLKSNLEAELRIGVPDYTSNLPGRMSIVTRLRETNPKLRVHIVSRPSSELLEQLQAGDLDAAICESLFQWPVKVEELREIPSAGTQSSCSCQRNPL